MMNSLHNKSATPLLEAQLRGHFHFNRPASPLASPSCALGRVLYVQGLAFQAPRFS